MQSLPIFPGAPQYVPAASVWSWSGFYVGANGGYGIASDNFTQTEVRAPGVVTEGSLCGVARFDVLWPSQKTSNTNSITA